MKSQFTTNLKDNVASAILLTATFVAIVGGIVTSNNAHADKAVQMETQIMETIVVTAPRIAQIVKMDAIIVTASRHADPVANFLVATK